MASIIKADTLQSTTSNVFVLNSVGTEYARFDSTGNFQLANPTTFPAGTALLPSITATGDTNTGLYFPAADTIGFTEGGVESMRIDSSGQVGIGTTSPAADFELKRTTNNTKLQVTSSYEAGIWLVNGGGAEVSVLNAGGSNILQLRTNNTERVKIDSTGLVTIASGQIKFPATQSASSDANTLDDYEEGTWTPTIGADSVDGTHTYSQQQGTYTKVGRLVTVQCVVVMTSKGGTVAGSVQIVGLPFTSFSTMLAMGTVGYFANLTNNVVMLKAYINPSVTRINISKMAAAGVNMTQMVAADLATATALYVSASYYTT